MHRHHIIPKHLGGSDSEENLTPPISVKLHAEFHRDLYEALGHVEDKIAWKALSGRITNEQVRLKASLQKTCKRVIIDGVEFDSYKKASAHYNVSPSRISHRLQNGVSTDDLLVHAASYGRFVFEGVEYKSLRDAADITGYSRVFIKSRLETPELGVNKRKQLPVVINGVEYKNAYVASEVTGIPRSTIQSRIRRGHQKGE